ncbi:hypothetical protein GL267_005955 [Acidithiobacillus ferrianus]|uniref:Uncharacterized protein n=2 Tax=Acidithiobacillus ferrianus TaxID=2678518 RepID=A0A845U2U8_9PROT|nr:hypothetical protein [Acidithiobacillus ferrianus]NDU41952.1 hypothetical protein [Acidithiobacillus ferrianus]
MLRPILHDPARRVTGFGRHGPEMAAHSGDKARAVAEFSRHCRARPAREATGGRWRGVLATGSRPVAALP